MIDAFRRQGFEPQKGQNLKKVQKEGEGDFGFSGHRIQLGIEYYPFGNSDWKRLGFIGIGVNRTHLMDRGWVHTEDGKQIRTLETLINLLPSLSEAIKPLYGAFYDDSQGEDFYPDENDIYNGIVKNFYLLNLFGAEIVSNLGRERIDNWPALRIIESSEGGIIVVGKCRTDSFGEPYPYLESPDEYLPLLEIK